MFEILSTGKLPVLFNTPSIYKESRFPVLVNTQWCHCEFIRFAEYEIELLNCVLALVPPGPRYVAIPYHGNGPFPDGDLLTITIGSVVEPELNQYDTVNGPVPN